MNESASPECKPFVHKFLVCNYCTDVELALLEFQATRLEHLACVAFEVGDYAKWVLMHAGEFRQLAFDEICENIPLASRFAVLGEIWNDKYIPAVSGCFLASHTRTFEVSLIRRFLMTPEEQAALTEFGEYTELFRAHGEGNRDGISWCTSRKCALDYGLCYGYDKLRIACVHRDQIVAVFLRRGFTEVIAYPESVLDVKEKMDQESLR